MAFLKKPLITTPTGGLKEVCIDNITGLQVPIYSPKLVIQAILRLKNDETFRNNLAENAKKHSEIFCLDKMLKRIDFLYQKI